MPSWILNLLIQLIIKMGFPWIVKFLIDKFPGLDPAILDILKKLLEGLESSSVPNSVARAFAKKQFKDHCNGVACESEIVE